MGSEMCIRDSSEGGVIIRLALRDLELSIDRDVPDVELILFAPAIGGINLAGVRGLANGLGGALMRWSGAYNDLMGYSSLLGNLRVDTQNFAAKEAQPEPFSPWRSLNVWAETDGVVIRDNYSCDGFKDSPGSDHFSVCKPTNHRSMSLKIVAGEVHAD